MSIHAFYKYIVGMISLILIFALAVPPSMASSTYSDDTPSRVDQDSNVIYLPLVQNKAQDYNLVFWHTWNDTLFASYQSVIYDFHALHPRIHITLVRKDDLPGDLINAVPIGAGPDIVAYANDWIGEWAASNLIAPIDSYFNTQFFFDTFEPAAAKSVFWHNQVWAIPDTQEGIALVYNKALIGSGDLPNPDSFSDLLIKASQYQASHPGKIYLCNQGLGETDAYHVAPIYFGFGLKNYGGYVDEQGNAYMDTAEALNAANWIINFRPYGEQSGSYGRCQDGLIHGEIGIWWTGPWAIGALADAGIDYGIASMGNPFVGIKSYMMTPNAASRNNTHAVIDLLQYLGSAEVQKKLALTNGTTPANTDALYDPVVQALYSVARFGDSMHRGVPMGNSEYIPCQWEPVGAETQAIWNGTKTPFQAMQDAQAAIEACIAGKTIIRLWHTWSGVNLANYQIVLNDYLATHPNLYITLAQKVDLVGDLISAVPIGSGPDIVAYASDWIGELSALNLISPLDTYFNMSFLTGTYEPAAAKGVVLNNQIWAIPDTQEGIALVYNKALIGSGDLPNPDSFSDLLIKASQYQASHPGKIYLCNQGLGETDAYHVAPIYFGFGLKNYGGYVDEQGNAYMDTAEALNAANWIINFRPYGEQSGSYGRCQDGLIHGEIGIWWTGPWAIGALAGAGIDYGIASMGNPFVGIKSYMMTPNAASRNNTHAVIDLLQYLGSAEVQKKLSLANSTIPANTAALNDPAVQALTNVARFGDSLHRGIPMGNSRYAPCQWKPVGDETQAIWNGTKTPLQAMQDAQAAIEACIAAMDAQR